MAQNLGHKVYLKKMEEKAMVWKNSKLGVVSEAKAWKDPEILLGRAQVDKKSFSYVKTVIVDESMSGTESFEGRFEVVKLESLSI